MPESQKSLIPTAGIALESTVPRPDGVPLDKGEYSIASRALALSTYFLSGALSINLTQMLGSPLYLVNKDWYNAWIAFTKQSFGLLTMSLTQAFAPTKVIVSGDKSVRGQLMKSVDGNLILDFPERIVLIANHQIYTDWLYLWWIAYCNSMHGRLYIILKESLKQIPVLGWGMQFSQFIFLKRKWEQDKPHMAVALQRLNKLVEPMWLLLFPEGTNLAPSTRERSAAWAKKNGMSDMRHLLLPRSTGLHFCLNELKTTVDYLYDCTVAYEGVPRGQYAQDIFTLKAGYLEGRPPKSVSMYWRRFAIKNIPIHDEKAFELWLTARWREKDLLIEHYLVTGKFPADSGGTRYKSGKVLRGCGYLGVQIRSSHWYEFLQIFAPMGILAMVLYTFYNALPQRFWKSINKQAIKTSTDEVKKIGQQTKDMSNSMSSMTLDSIFDADKQQDSFKHGAMAVQKWLNSSQAQAMLNNVDFAQKFLENPQQAVIDNVSSKQTNFKKLMEDEELKRQQKQIAGSLPHIGSRGGTFWQEIEAAEKSKNGSIISESSQGIHGKFWRDLQAAEERKKRGETFFPTSGKFWESLKTEENSRYGTVVTLSSNASTAVPSAKSAPVGSLAAKNTALKTPNAKPKPSARSVMSAQLKSTPESAAASKKQGVKKPPVSVADSTPKKLPGAALSTSNIKKTRTNAPKLPEKPSTASKSPGQSTNVKPVPPKPMTGSKTTTNTSLKTPANQVQNPTAKKPQSKPPSQAPTVNNVPKKQPAKRSTTQQPPQLASQNSKAPTTVGNKKPVKLPAKLPIQQNKNNQPSTGTKKAVQPKKLQSNQTNTKAAPPKLALSAKK